ncbi:hypothetical protein BKA56DRAFT_729742 [Ilyonectria sp. MPI-CAGE-AT-0026]|nr:hypothetical protein BKA56DRAFT_729742 [Ilyonectria sp. MPI-CAGE-AT-0026]
MAKFHKNWQYGPLNLLLRQVAPNLCLWDGGFDGAYWNFKCLTDIKHGRRGDELARALENAVSTSQWLSLDCIHQWWAGPLRTSLKTVQLQTVLENACHIAEGWPIEHEPFDAGQLYGRDIITPGDPGCDESDYARELFHLYLHEFFFPREAVNADFIHQLERRRSRCQQLVNVHKLAHAVFPDLVNNRMRPPRISPSYGIGEPSLGASSSPTPWLNPTVPANKDRPRESPRFLWDLKKRKTIDTNYLSQVPGYTVLSHTWGRWRKIVNGKPSSVRVDGVPWPVPENTLYDVLELPAKLERLADQWPHTACLWFDLFCIPQDGAGPEMMEIQKAEIARQAVIFDRATIGSIWLNEIETWSPLEDAILWLLLDYLGRCTDVMKRQEGFDNPAFRWAVRMQELSKGIPLERTSRLASLVIPTEETKSVIRELEALSVSAGAGAAAPGRSSPDPKDFKLGWQDAMERLSRLEDTELAKRLKEALRKKLNNFQTDQNRNLGVLLSAGLFDDLGAINQAGLLRGDPEAEELAQDCLQQPLYNVLDSTRVEQSFTGMGTILRLGPGMEIEKDWGNINYLTTVKPAGWLTSLWTLQEACLRPRMRLLNKDLEPLAMGTCGQEVTFDTLCALVHGLDGEMFKLQDGMFKDKDHLVQILVRSPNSNMPPGVIELVASLVATGMHRFLDISPLDLLELGSRRWCSRRRGPAVMSAVGVTDWFEALSIGEAEHEEDLVLDCYPYSFVQSVREKVGAEFFASKRDRIRYISSPTSNMTRLTGTMMPFYWGCSTARWRPQDMQDHPSTKGWEVTETGSVKIKEACILVSTSAEPPAEAVKAAVFLEPQVAKALRPLRIETQNLYKLMNIVVSGEAHFWSALKAVVLMSSPTQVEGILLLEWAFPGTISKVGYFYIEGTQLTLPEQEIVNWEVS